MAEVIYSGVFGHTTRTHTQKRASITITPASVNTTYQLWDKFIRDNSLTATSAYNKWELLTEEYEFKDPPWSSVDELKSDLKSVQRIQELKTVHSRNNHMIIKVSVPKYTSNTTIEENVTDYFDGLEVKSNYPKTTIVIVSPERHISKNS